MMKILFTNSTVKRLHKFWEYTFALFVLFLVASYFSVPSVLRNGFGSIEGTIESIKLKQEAIPQSIKSYQDGHHDYYEVVIKEDKFIYKSSYNPNMESIRSFGLDRLVGQRVRIMFYEQSKYRSIHKLQLGDVMIVNTKNVGFFPFLLFVGLTILFLCWGLWGFYVAYLISDEKRKALLME